MASIFCYYDLISAEVSDELINFKYKGSDASIIYSKIITHVCQWLNDTFTPVWVA